MEAKALVIRLPSARAEKKAETVFITLGNVMAETLADKLADTLGDAEAY